MKKLVIACKTVEKELSQLVSPDVELKGLEQGLHRHPDRLRETLQAEIDSTDADVVLLAYGMCGNGVVGLKSDTARLVVPKVDDCIAVLLGSYERYRTEFDAEPGTYWFSHGWVEHSQDPYKEYLRVLDKYDEDTARWVAGETMKGYHRAVLIETSACSPESLRPYVQQFAEFFGLRYEETTGTEELLRKMAGDDYSPQDFVVVEPGQTITVDMFNPSTGLPNG